MTLLDVDKLKKRYVSDNGDTFVALDIARFSMATGEQVGLRGASGSGKTTFLNVIAGILTPDDGEVRILGRLISGVAEAKRDRLRARYVGYVFQTFNLLQGFTCLENLQLAMGFSGTRDSGRAEGMLERVGLFEKRHAYPRELSVGQQQRVALARALVNEPELVLADEPTGSLDPRSAENALELIQDVCAEKGAGLLLVSHDESALRRFRRADDLRDLNKAAIR